MASVVTRATGAERLPLAELARIAYFARTTLPPGFQAELMATRHYVPRASAVRSSPTASRRATGGRHRVGLRHAAQALVRGGLRHRDHPQL